MRLVADNVSIAVTCTYSLATPSSYCIITVLGLNTTIVYLISLIAIMIMFHIALSTMQNLFRVVQGFAQTRASC